MTPSNAIEQILAFLPNAEYRSTIYVLPEEQEDTWNVAIEDKRSDRIPFWTGPSEDPTSALQQYITANPDQQLRMITFTPIQRFP
jgi:hypothetical protein